MHDTVRLAAVLNTAQFQLQPNRRLVDKLVLAANAACDEDALPVAEMLLHLINLATKLERQRIVIDRRSRRDVALARLHRRIFCLRAAGTDPGAVLADQHTDGGDHSVAACAGKGPPLPSGIIAEGSSLNV